MHRLRVDIASSDLDDDLAGDAAAAAGLERGDHAGLAEGEALGDLRRHQAARDHGVDALEKRVRGFQEHRAISDPPAET